MKWAAIDLSSVLAFSARTRSSQENRVATDRTLGGSASLLLVDGDVPQQPGDGLPRVPRLPRKTGDGVGDLGRAERQRRGQRGRVDLREDETVAGRGS